MAAEHELPTWAEITRHARASLDAARTDAAAARDWLASDCRPAGSELTPEAADARREVLTLIAEITERIEKATNALADAGNEEQA